MQLKNKNANNLVVELFLKRFRQPCCKKPIHSQNNNMKISKFTIITVSLLAITSCDKQVGENGVVEDFTTGERLHNVEVKMTSSQGNKTDTTNLNGYFSVIKNFSCGFFNCQDDYQIKLIKNGYDTLTIDQNYYKSDLAEYVNEEKRDTLIVKLKTEN